MSRLMNLSMRLVKPCMFSGGVTSTHVKPPCCTLTHPAGTKNTKLTHNMLQTVKNWETLLHPIENDDYLFSASMFRPVEALGENWKEYQGTTDWEGMLDPLDEKLRGEILRYGKFTEAAYRSCDFDHATCRYPNSTLFQGCGMHEVGYRVTKTLQATAGIQVPKWMEKAPGRISAQSSYIGYVAVCDDKEEIARLGRRDVVIALRGSATWLEWLENFKATLTNIEPNNMADDPESPMVESGFLSLYTSGMPSLQDMVKDEFGRILQAYGGEPLSLTITGHSLGAALAVLAAHDIRTSFERAHLVTAITFGCPRVGNLSFRGSLEKLGTKVLRVVNHDDVITRLPGFVIDDEDDDNITSVTGAECRDGRDISVIGLPSWMQKRQWEYAEVGKELRLRSKNSSFLDSINVSRCHELNTYMELIYGFGSLNCSLDAA